ncbi:MAG TPA: hypothetical protein VJB59_14050 [Bdellovibrionota bacterium]|nr:hypothetical protein [Bdellovibrionota bacterium]
MGRIQSAARQFSFAILAVVLAGSVAPLTLPSSWADSTRISSDFVQGMTELRAPVRYLKQALQNLSGIGFVALPENAIAVYNRLTNRITFGLEMQDRRTGGLKSFAELSDDEVATVAHELFHCYFSTAAKRTQDDFYEEWQKSAVQLYSSAFGRPFDVHEEAYAAFITITVQNYVNIRRMMAARTPAARDRLRRNHNIAAIYEQTFQESVFGYYRNFWGEFITSDVNLPRTDRENILTNLYDGELPENFAAAFAESRF